MDRRSILGIMVGLLVAPKVAPAAEAAPVARVVGAADVQKSATMVLSVRAGAFEQFLADLRQVRDADPGDLLGAPVVTPPNPRLCPGAVAALRAVEMRAVQPSPHLAARAAGGGLHPSAGRSIASRSGGPVSHAGNVGRELN